MATKDNGGAAFPSRFSLGSDGHGNEAFGVEQGMSLRDWFAGQALVGALAFPGVVNGSRDKSAAAVVRAAYTYADAMLAERSK